MSSEWFGQVGFAVRFEWGRDGARAAAARGDILVVVDVLRFTSVVAAVVAAGGLVFPCGEGSARERAAELGLPYSEPADPGEKRARLSPRAYLGLSPGSRCIIASPNGAVCSRLGESAPALLAGSLLNATAAARRAAGMRDRLGSPITVVACGERWGTPGEDGALRPAVEDYLGAGAILAGLPGPRSPEAEVCAAAFLAACRRRDRNRSVRR